MLLVAILSILSGQSALMGMERFSKRHRKTLNELLGTHAAKPPLDSTFRCSLNNDALVGDQALDRPAESFQPPGCVCGGCCVQRGLTAVRLG
jgi:hypothetical protein